MCAHFRKPWPKTHLAVHRGLAFAVPGGKEHGWLAPERQAGGIHAPEITRSLASPLKTCATGFASVENPTDSPALTEPVAPKISHNTIFPGGCCVGGSAKFKRPIPVNGYKKRNSARL